MASQQRESLLGGKIYLPLRLFPRSVHTWLTKKKEFIALKEHDFPLQVPGHEITIYYIKQYQSSVSKLQIEKSLIGTFQMNHSTCLSTAEATVFQF